MPQIDPYSLIGQIHVNRVRRLTRTPYYQMAVGSSYIATMKTVLLLLIVYLSFIYDCDIIRIIERKDIDS